MASNDTFIATQPLFIGRDRAHNEGDEVPADNVARNGWEDLVAKGGTKAALRAQVNAGVLPAEALESSSAASSGKPAGGSGA